MNRWVTFAGRLPPPMITRWPPLEAAAETVSVPGKLIRTRIELPALKTASVNRPFTFLKIPNQLFHLDSGVCGFACDRNIRRAHRRIEDLVHALKGGRQFQARNFQLLFFFVIC